MSDPDRFVVDGRGLAFWLWELVSDDPDRRHRAAGAVQELLCPWTVDAEAALRTDPERWQADFAAAVRGVVGAPGFPTGDYLTRLLTVMELAQRTRMGMYRRDQVLDDFLFARLSDWLRREGASEGRTRRWVFRALDRVIRGRADRGRLEESLLAQCVAGLTVCGTLRGEFLAVPDWLLGMLRGEREHGHVAAAALERIGPPAVRFADELFAQLDAGRRGFDKARALASVIRDDPERVRSLAGRLGSRSAGVVTNAATALYFLEARAAEFAPGCVPALLALSGRPDVAWSAVAALGRVTRGTDAALDRLLEASHDADVWLRGAAITALGDLRRCPERVVPRLIDAFDDYQEPDPDWQYRSDHGRVAAALEAFGPDAAPAVPALVARLTREDGSYDSGVLAAVAAVGPAAREALPVLERFARDAEYGERELADPHDALAVALRSLRGT